MKETKDFYFNLSIRSNGDQMNVLLLILHWIPISTLPYMECNSALFGAYYADLMQENHRINLFFLVCDQQRHLWLIISKTPGYLTTWLPVFRNKVGLCFPYEYLNRHVLDWDEFTRSSGLCRRQRPEGVRVMSSFRDVIVGFASLCAALLSDISH